MNFEIHVTQKFWNIRTLLVHFNNISELFLLAVHLCLRLD